MKSWIGIIITALAGTALMVWAVTGARGEIGTQQEECVVKYCDVCSRNLTYESKDKNCYSLDPRCEVLSMFTLESGLWRSKELKEFTKEVMKPYDVEKKYYICGPCFLRALGVKPGGTGGPR